MTYPATIDALKKLGTEENRAKAMADGAGDKAIGVSPAKLSRLAKKITVDQELAIELWHSQIPDARILATIIADPSLSAELLDKWVKEIQYHAVADAFVTNLVVRTAAAKDKVTQWIKSKEEFIMHCGYSIMAHLAQSDPSIPDSEFQDFLFEVRGQIQSAPNWSREAMYHTLIAIGKRNKRLNTEVIMLASEVGKVYVESAGKIQPLPSIIEILADKKLRESLT